MHFHHERHMGGKRQRKSYLDGKVIFREVESFDCNESHYLMGVVQKEGDRHLNLCGFVFRPKEVNGVGDIEPLSDGLEEFDAWKAPRPTIVLTRAELERRIRALQFMLKHDITQERYEQMCEEMYSRPST